MSGIAETLKEIFKDNKSVLSEKDWEFVDSNRQVTLEILENLAENDYDGAKDLLEKSLNNDWISQNVYLRMWYHGSEELQEILADLLLQADEKFPGLVTECLFPEKVSITNLIEPNFRFEPAGVPIANIISLKPKAQCASSLKIPIYYIKEKHCTLELKETEEITTTNNAENIIITNLPTQSTAHIFHYALFKKEEMLVVETLLEKFSVSSFSENYGEYWWKRHVKTEQESKKMYEKFLYVLGEYEIDNEIKKKLALFFWNLLNKNSDNLELMKSNGYSKFVDYRKSATFPDLPYGRVLFIHF